MPPNNEKLRQKERTLFLSVWLVLILLGGIWYFTTQRTLRRRIAPAVFLSPEISHMFSQARVTDFSPTKYQVQLEVRPEYQQALRDEAKTFRLGFRYQGNQGLLETGVTTCVIKKREPTSTLTLDNPNILTAQKIDLLLAH